MIKAVFCLVLILTLFTAGACHARVGSVISTFSPWHNYREVVDTIYRDGEFVYGVVRDETKPWTAIYKYTPSGSFVAGGPGLDPYGSYGDTDHSTLGSGCFSVVFDGNTVQDIDLLSGSVVNSWAPFSGIKGYAYIPGGRYKYVSDGNCVYRYTAGGSLASSFFVPAGVSSVSATGAFCGQKGEYIVVTKDADATVFNTSGKQVTKFRLPKFSIKNFSSVCGVGYPAECGTTFWCLEAIYYGVYVCQISIGNGVAVEPASVGKIKALFR